MYLNQTLYILQWLAKIGLFQSFYEKRIKHWAKEEHAFRALRQEETNPLLDLIVV
jgi:hypothetical protein